MSITPDDVKSYTTFDVVKNRPDELLESDIIEAEIYVEAELNRPLDELEQPLPKEITLALKKVAQYYALINSDESIIKGYKSEKIGDYSYTLEDGSLKMPDISNLIRKYVKIDPSSQGGARMRLRSL